MGQGRSSGNEPGRERPPPQEVIVRRHRRSSAPLLDLGDFFASAGLDRPPNPKWVCGPNLFLESARKVAVALRSKRGGSVLEMLVFRTTLRLLQMSQEGSYESDNDDNDQMSVAGDDSESNGDERPTALDFSVHTADMLARTPADDVLKAAHLKQLIAGLRKAELPPADEAKRIIYAAYKHLEALPNLMRCEVPESGRFVVVGDIHGQLQDLNCILEAHGGPSPSTPFLFNGDFVDRGKQGLEVVLILFCYLLLDPTAVFLNRGNHEDDFSNKRYGFQKEVAVKYAEHGREVYGLIQDTFLRLPLMYIIGGSICVTHGGLPEDENIKLDEIDQIDRRQPPRLGLPLFEQAKLPRLERIYQGLLWSDPKDFPSTSSIKSKPSVRGAGCYFGKALVDKFLDGNGLETLIRSHEVCSSGYDKHHGGKTITVFSASNYGGTDDNQACHLVIQPSLQIGYEQHTILKTGSPHLLEDAARFVKKDSDQAWLVGAKQECMKLLRQAIFAKRQELFHEFEVADRLMTGKVTLNQWVNACQVCIHAELPWFSLSRHLVVRETRHGRVFVAYMPFLERFQNRLARNWMIQWANKLKPFIAERLAKAADENGGYLSYFDMVRAMQEMLPGIKERAVYYILMAFCPGGRAKSSVFWAVAESANAAAPCVLDLWVMVVFRKDSWKKFAQEWAKKMGAEEALREGRLLPPLPADDFAQLGMKHCNVSSTEARQRWLVTAQRLAKPGSSGVDFRSLTLATHELGSEWTRASQVLDILSTLARMSVGVQQLFTCLDVDGDGCVSLEEFADSVQELVGHRMTPKEVAVIFRALDSSASGSLSLEEIDKGLSVMDSWDVCDATAHKIAGMHKVDTLSAIFSTNPFLAVDDVEDA